MLDLLVRYRKYSILGLVVVAAVALLTAQQTRPGEGLWLAEGIAAVTAPAQMAFARVHRGAASLWAGYLDWKHLRAEVARLRAETVALRLRQLRQEALEAENIRLRTLSTLRERLPERTLGAEVVARDWNGFTRGLTIDRGRAGGLDRLSAVIVTSGVVGRVAVLRRQSAIVQVLTDPASSIGGVVLRTRAQGLVEGVAGGRLRIKLAVSEEGLQPGDLVVTSGIGELFPKGLPLGRVLRVYAPTGLFRTAELEPAVDLTSVEEVLVLPRGTGGDLAPVFQES
ncbi:MAG: rod shape-determining protein MreC [Solirubrobacterales bacterium]